MLAIVSQEKGDGHSVLWELTQIGYVEPLHCGTVHRRGKSMRGFFASSFYSSISHWLEFSLWGINSLVLRAGWVTWPDPCLLGVVPHLSSEVRQPEPPWV